MQRVIPLPVRLGLLVASTTLPLILFAAVITYQHYADNRREAFDRVTQVTRGVQLVFDREMQGIVSGLTVLAASHSLAQDDFVNFRRNAEAFINAYPEPSAIVVADKNGQEVFNSSLPAGAALPLRGAPDRGEVFRTGRPTFSPAYVGKQSKRLIVLVTVPVFRDGKVVYDLSFNPPQSIFQRIVEQQKPGDEWTISIFDQNGTNFARVPNPEGTVGQKASPSLYNVLFSATEGRAETVSLEGVKLLTAFTRSPLTGWIVAAGVAESTLTAPALRTFMLTAAVGTIMLVIGLISAITMARQVVRAEGLHDLLIDELNHRVKNTLATVQSLSVQTFRNSGDIEAREKFGGRLAALGSTYDILSRTKWEGTTLHDVLAGTLRPFETANRDRIRIDGPEVKLSSRAAVIVSMVIHELATNAAKYGALSSPEGRINVRWDKILDGSGSERVNLVWREADGPTVKNPDRKGFGSTLIEKGFAAQLGGHADLTFDSDGLRCTLEFSPV
jgi:two-component sensor histidine kinase